MGVGHNEQVEWWENKTAEEIRGRFLGEYAGFCVDRDDPKKLGRIRIHCPAIMPGDPGKSRYWLPWALPKGGSMRAPPLEAPVWVKFEMGHIQHPVYEWGWLKGTDEVSSEVPLAAKEQTDPTWKKARRQDASGSGAATIGATVPADAARTASPAYGFNKVFESEGGQILELDDSAGPRARYSHPSGTSILIDPDGSVHIRSRGAIFNEPGGDYVVQLREGATFKVVYEGGSSLSVGPQGVISVAHQIVLGGRFVRQNGDPI